MIFAGWPLVANSIKIFCKTSEADLLKSSDRKKVKNQNKKQTIHKHDPRPTPPPNV